MKIFRIYLILILSPAIFLMNCRVFSQEFEIPVQVKFIRAYGGENERNPAILLLQSGGAGVESNIGDMTITIDFDIVAPVIPNLYAKFVHCNYDWTEDENVFLNDVVFSKTSNIIWESAPLTCNYYNYRGKISIPNEQVKFKFSGNWKMKLYEYYKDSLPLAEQRFFVVSPKVNTDMVIYSEFYEPRNSVTPSALSFDIPVTASQEFYDNQLNTVVLYKNHRWLQPYYITERSNNSNDQLYYYKFPTRVSGFATTEKRFRIERIPAENAYRILNLSSLAEYPRTTGAVRMPLIDLRRNGSFWEYDDDGAMITSYMTYYMQDYVLLEFVMDPFGWVSERDVFVAGSFNNWQPDVNWMMYYDKEDELYKLRQYVRRARHNYIYCTGRLNTETNIAEKLAFDDYEGNGALAKATYIAFVYYRDFNFGGYDAIVGISAGNIFGFYGR